MFLNEKNFVKRCTECGAVVSRQNDGFCHECNVFFEDIANRWFDPTNKDNDQSWTGGLTFPK